MIISTIVMVVMLLIVVMLLVIDHWSLMILHKIDVNIVVDNHKHDNKIIIMKIKSLHLKKAWSRPGP